MHRIGIVGCGWILRSMYAPALQSLADTFSVAAVCDLNETAARSAAEGFPGAELFTDAARMLATAEPDAVLVLTSEKVNAAMAQIVLQSGRPVYLEKPPAVNSAQLEELIAAEKRSGSFIYTAFNRRHTPLCARLDFNGEKIVKVSGALRREGRVVKTFPYTAIHVIDSSQFFAGSVLASWKINFRKKAAHSIWRIGGTLGSGAEIALDFVPDGKEFAEHLVFESATRTWGVIFPNTGAATPEGEIVITTHNGVERSRIKGDASLSACAAMGFRDCLRDFAARLREKSPSPLHRLDSCRATIRVMEEMEALAG